MTTTSDPLSSDSLLALATFGALVLDEFRLHYGDLDGGWLQDKAEECGLIVGVEVNEPCDLERCRCAEVGAWPLICYRRTEAAKALDRE